MDLAKIIIAGKTRNYTDLDAVEIAMAKKLGGGATAVPFATGTDEQILAMIQAAHAGTLDLQTDGGWAVGDTRTISIAAFTAGGVSFGAQNVDIFISSFDEYMSCGNVIQFDFKNALAEGGRMNSSDSTAGGYGASEMKITTLPALVNAMPDWIKNQLIEFSVLVNVGGFDTTIETVSGNKLALRSETEAFGTSTSSGAPGQGAQLAYYATKSNRKKKSGISGVNGKWWLRSPRRTSQFVRVDGDGDGYYENASNNVGIAPFGCL